MKEWLKSVLAVASIAPKMSASGARPKHAVLMALAAYAGLSAVVHAQNAYPERTVEVILPYAAGGGVDAMARAFSREASELTGQQWIVTNRPGGGGVVGFSALANAKPDAYTIVFSPASALTNAPFLVKMPFKPEQIEPVCQAFENVFTVAVNADSPVKSLDELVARAKAAPGTVSYGHAGPGSVPHLGVAALEKALKISFNGVGYKGDSQMLPDLLGGNLDFGAPAISSLSGKNVRVLAVLSGSRHPALPDVPSITELGYPAVTPGLNGLFLPAGTPEPLVEKVEALCKKIIESDSFAKAAKALQQAPAFLPRDKFKSRLDATYKLHAELIPSIGLKK
jgi:tripartite-type tricarboxylate transporter receptor subunit TctC